MTDKPEDQLVGATSAALGLRASSEPFDSALDYVRHALAGLQFGQIAIIVQDGVVVQVERTERKRFRRGENRA